jgi:hypothetical protein
MFVEKNIKPIIVDHQLGHFFFVNHNSFGDVVNLQACDCFIYYNIVINISILLGV